MIFNDLLFRNVNPSWLTEKGAVQSVAFRPMPSDGDLLSVDCGNITTPDHSFSHFTDTLGNQSAGVVALHRDECASYDLPVQADPVTKPAINDAHHLIDFSAYSKTQQRKVGKRLAHVANERGWLLQP